MPPARKNADGALEAANRVLGDVCRPVQYNARELPCSCSIGLAAGTDADALLCDVDIALCASRRGGRAASRASTPACAPNSSGRPRSLPIDILKLDQSLTRDIVADPQAQALCVCVLGLACRRKLRVVAEGVETQALADLLSRAGCEAMQGYWFARPQRSLEGLLAGSGG